jgi:hypothetical protein
MEEAPWWQQVPVLIIVIGMFIVFVWLSSKSWKADDAGVPKTLTLVITRNVVALAYIVVPIMRIFGVDTGVWVWIGRVLGFACLVAFPIWVVAEMRRGTIRTRWNRGNDLSPDSEKSSEVDGSDV